MSNIQLQNARKRKVLGWYTSYDNDSSERTSKIQKRSHPSVFQFPTAFWDNLSKVDLTKRAIEELDRRNTQAAVSAQSSSYLASRAPATQHTTAKAVLRPDKYLSCCGGKDFKAIQRFARHGGPNLLDLRDVCLLKCNVVKMFTDLLVFVHFKQSRAHDGSKISHSKS